MKARALLIGASFDPDTLKRVCKAFDDAWEQIAPDIGDRPHAVEAARTKLANIILGLATNGTADDPEALTRAALDLMVGAPREL